jgi:hypothetical protein
MLASTEEGIKIVKGTGADHDESLEKNDPDDRCVSGE